MLNILNTSQRIILLTATTHFDDESIETLKLLLKDNPDWLFIKQFTVAQGTAPFLFKALKKHNLNGLVPADVYNYLQNVYFQTQAKNMLALDQLKKVLSAFNKEAIKTVLLKGMASAAFIHKDLGLRPMGDIDIMTETSRLLDAEKILFESGYINFEPYKSFKLRNLSIYNHLNAFLNKNIKIELHRDLSSIHHIYRIPNKKIWENLKQISFENEPAFVLNTAYNLMYLSLHAVSHFLKKKIRLNSFVDISELIKNEKSTIDWSLIEKESKAFKITFPVYRALSLCKTFLGAPVPDAILENLKGNEEGLENEFLNLLNNQPELITFKATTDYFKKMRNIEGLKNKCLYLLSEAFPSKAYMVYTYKLKHENLFFLYYFAQFYKQVTKSFRNIFRK